MNNNLKEYENDTEELCETSDEVVEESESLDEFDNEEVTVEEDKDAAPEIISVELKFLNAFQLRLLKNTLDRLGIEDNFEIITIKDNIVYDEDNNITGLNPYSVVRIKDLNSENIYDLIDNELLIEDGNGVSFKIHMNDKVYIKGQDSATFKGIICGFGYDYNDNDIEIDMIITINGLLSFIRYMYSDKNISIFSLSDNLSKEVLNLIKAIER